MHELGAVPGGLGVRVAEGAAPELARVAAWLDEHLWPPRRVLPAG